LIKHIKFLPELHGLILVVVAVAWMAGILLESWLSLPSGALLIGATMALVCVILLWRNNRGMLVSLILLWLLLGAWRYAIVSPAADPRAITTFIGTGKVDLRGTLADEPKFSDRSSSLQVAVNSISTNGGSSWQDAHGQLEVQISGGATNNLYGPNYGDDVELQGKVQPPFPHHSPEVLASMIFPQLSLIGSGGNPFLAALFKLRLSLAAIITQSLPQPMAAVLIAILLSGDHSSSGASRQLAIKVPSCFSS
jgi:hypothetical protein